MINRRWGDKKQNIEEGEGTKITKTTDRETLIPPRSAWTRKHNSDWLIHFSPHIIKLFAAIQPVITPEEQMPGGTEITSWN